MFLQLQAKIVSLSFVAIAAVRGNHGRLWNIWAILIFDNFLFEIKQSQSEIYFLDSTLFSNKLSILK